MVRWILHNICLFAALLLLAPGCSNPEKPALNGSGPLAVQIDADKLVIPEYHNPMETWKPRHMQAIQQGEFTERECMTCHVAATSCNNCHGYVGVPAVGEYTPPGFQPGVDRTEQAVNGTTKE